MSKASTRAGVVAVAILVIVLAAVGYRRLHPSAPATTPITAAGSESPPAPANAASAPPPSADGIALAEPDAAAVQVSSAPTAWGGPRTGSEATLSDRVVDYTIQAKLDPEAHTIEGKQRLVWRNRSAREVRSVYLHLYLNAFEGEGSTFMSEKRQLGFGFRSEQDVKDGDWGYTKLQKVEQNGAAVPWLFVHPDGGPSSDHTVVRLDLPAPVAAGASTALDIDFFDQLPRVLARTGYFGSFHLVGQWFPKIGVLELPGERGATAPRWNVHEFHLHSEFYADFGRYDVKIDVPDGVTVGATGEELDAPVSQGGRTTHHFVQGDVHDFAWTADKRSAAPLEGVYQGAGSPTVKVKVLFPPEYAHNAEPVLKATLAALDWFSKTLGPYPYKTVTAVIPPFNAGEAGGMEYPTFFTADSFGDVTPGTLNAYALDFVTIHEFGHGYFYGILASNEFEEPMLDEGLNEYWDLRMIRAAQQRITLATSFTRLLGLRPTVDVFALERAISVQGDPSDGLGANSWNRLSSGSYSSVYGRTATAMHDLEEQLGRPVLEKAFQTYYARWKYRHPSVADLRDVLAEVSGQAAIVDNIFRQHVYHARKVDDRVERLVSEEELPLLGAPQGAKALTEEERDEAEGRARKAWKEAHPEAKDGVGGPYPYRTTVTLRRRGAAAPQTLVVKFADGSIETVQWNDDTLWKRYSWVKPVRAVSAELDPKGLNTLDTNLLDNSRTIKADRRASLRVSADAASLAQALFALITTL